MSVKTETFFQDRLLLLIWWLSNVWTNISKQISWDPAVTTINSATMYCSIWTQFQSGAQIIFNDTALLTADGTLGDVTVEDTIDVTGLLKNGSNRVDIGIWKLPVVTADKSARFTAILNIDYTGDDPDIRPWWQKYLMPALVIGSTVFALIAGISALKRKK